MFTIPLAFCFAKHKRNEERERENMIERKEEPEREEKKEEEKNIRTLFLKNPPQIQNLKDFSFYLKSMEYQLIPDVWATMKILSRI